MPSLSSIPETIFNMRMPNLDFVSDFHLELTESDASWTALNHLVLLIRRAHAAASHAVSWRDKFVGAAACSIDVQSSRLAILGGFNVKPEEHGGINIHAEQMAIERIRRLGFKTVQAIAIWGDPEFNETTNQTPNTLHPCDLCIDFMEETPEVADNTAILSGNTDFSVCELYGLNALKEYNNSGSGDLHLRRFTLADRAIERPDYDAALGIWLLDAWAELNPNAPHAQGFQQWFEAGQPT